MKRRFTLLLLLISLLGIANTALADDLTVGDVSNSGCKSTRSESVAGHQILKLTRTESGLVGELRDYWANCGYEDIKVMCEEDGQNLTINVNDDIEYWTNCECIINVYFTIFNALKDEYQITVQGKNVGTVSFKEHSVVEIDLNTLERAYEEGFEYPLKVEATTVLLQSGPGSDQSLDILHCDNCCFRFAIYNYVLPPDYSYIDVQPVFNEDSTLVVNVLTDGDPNKEGSQAARLSFLIYNMMKYNYHLQLNHTILNGTENEATACLYEGDITVPEWGKINVPISSNQQYTLAVLPQTTGSNAEAPYYDMQGRRIIGKPERGVYIQNGKKKVIR